MIGIYCRTSREESNSGIETIEQQREAGLKFVKDNNLEYAIFEDSGKSGYKEKSKEDPFKSRPAFKQLLKEIENGTITEIWVWELSRLARRNKYYVQVIETLAEQNIVLWVLNNKIDLQNPTQKALVGMQGIFAELERMEIVQRTTRGLYAATDRGNLRYQALYGYKNNPPEPNKEEIKNVRKIFDLFSNGFNYVEIAKELFKGVSNDKNHLSQLAKRTLTHEEYTSQCLKISGREIEKKFRKGEIPNLQELLNDKYWVDSVWYKEKIISREEWISAQEKLVLATLSHHRENKKDRLQRQTCSSLATGLIKCQNCEMPYYYHKRKKLGSEVYSHNSTMEKCGQLPKAILIDSVDTIFDVFFTFTYLCFNNTASEFRKIKTELNDSRKETEKELTQLKKKLQTSTELIDKLKESIIQADVSQVPDFVQLMKEATEEKKSIETKILTAKSDLDSIYKKEKYIDKSEKYKQNTLEIINKWFDLREQKNYSELREMLSDLLYTDLITIGDTIIEITSSDTGRSFYFDLDYDYTICYPFIEKILDRDLHKSYYNYEKHYIIKNKEKIDNFGTKVREFLLDRQNRPEEESFSNDFLFLPDCFPNIHYDYCGLCLYTEKREKLHKSKTGNCYYTTEVSKKLGVNAQTLRAWAENNGIEKTVYKDGIQRLIWKEEDIEKYIKAKRNKKQN